MHDPPDQNIDFLPQGYLQARGRKQTLTWHRTVVGVLGVLLVVGGIGERIALSRKIAERNRLQALLTQTQRHIVPDGPRTGVLRDKNDEAKLLTLLAMRPSVSRLLASIAEGTPNTVTWQSVSIVEETASTADSADRKRASQRKGDAAKSTPAARSLQELQPIVENRRLKIEILGTAATDAEVSRFLTRLESVPLLSAVRLQYSESAPSGGLGARKFAFDVRVRHLNFDLVVDSEPPSGAIAALSDEQTR